MQPEEGLEIVQTKSPRQGFTSIGLGVAASIGTALGTEHLMDGETPYSNWAQHQHRCELGISETYCSKSVLANSAEFGLALTLSAFVNIGLPALAGIFTSRAAANAMGHTTTVTTTRPVKVKSETSSPKIVSAAPTGP